MKRFASILLAVLVAIAVVGCSGNSATTTTAPAASKAASAATAAPAASTAAKPPVDKIKIGVVSAVSGAYALEGQFVKQALDILQEEVNSAGGVDYKGTKIPVQFLYEDGEGKPETSVNCFKKLIEQDKVLAIVGPPMSGCLLAAGPIAQAAKIPAIGTMTTNIKVTQVGDFIFRACFIDPFQGKVAAKYIKETLKVDKVAMLSNNADDYSTGLATSFKEAYTALGGTILEHQTYAGSDVKDFNVQLTKIKAVNPEVIFAPDYYMDVPLIIQQARAMGITGKFVGTDSWDTPEILKLAGKDIEGAEYVAAFSAQNPDPLAQAFTKKFKAKYNAEPNSNATFAYDSGLLVLEGIKNAVTLDGQGIRDAMAKIKDFKGATGTTTFDETRNPIKSAFIIRFTNGQATYVTTVQP